MDAKVRERRLAQWIPLFEEQAKSGMGKDAWCRANGIKRWEFYTRQKEYRNYLIEQAETDPAPPAEVNSLPAFFELPPALPAVIDQVSGDNDNDNQVISANPGEIEISYGRFNIKLRGHVDDTTLQQLIKAVANA